MKKQIIILTLGIVGFSSCKKDEEKPLEPVQPDINLTLKKAIVKNYADIVHTNYVDSYNKANELKTAISNFVASPSASSFQTCKDKWLEAREPYGQTEAFRFAGGPIDDSDGPEGLLNAWPLDEAYIDYVQGTPNSGIVNDLTKFPTINKVILDSLNEKGGEKNISIGYHAIEFLLWGQDLTSPSLKQAGQRPYTDFVVGAGGTASNQARRGQYLILCSELLLEHLQLMVDEWKPSVTSNYRKRFLALDPNVAIKNMLTGIGVLSKSELAGERIFTAYDNQDQEDEHSCFSDNTHRDVRTNWKGIKNVYQGSYLSSDGMTVISGSSIADLMNIIDPTFAAAVNTVLNKANTDTEATGIPFDYAIFNATERPIILTSVNSLRSFGDKVAEVGSKLGLTINTALPE